jgi:hypothetical protein
MESLQLLIPTALDALLAQRAVKEGQTKADIVRAALEAYLAPQTPLERSLQKLERTTNDRFDRLERLLRQERGTPYGQRSASGVGSVPVAAPSPQTDPENSPNNDPDPEEEDEADEILPEFLEFASSAVQQRLELLS